jgi:hypothetical protein
VIAHSFGADRARGSQEVGVDGLGGIGAEGLGELLEFVAAAGIHRVQRRNAAGIGFDDDRAPVFGVAPPMNPSLALKARQDTAEGGDMGARALGKVGRGDGAVMRYHVENVKVGRPQPDMGCHPGGDDRKLDAEILQCPLNLFRARRHRVSHLILL